MHLIKLRLLLHYYNKFYNIKYGSINLIETKQNFFRIFPNKEINEMYKHNNIEINDLK